MCLSMGRSISRERVGHDLDDVATEFSVSHKAHIQFGG